MVATQVDADFLGASLANVDRAVLGDVLEAYRAAGDAGAPLRADTQAPLAALAALLGGAGFGDPLATVYVAKEPPAHLPDLLLLFLLSYAHKLAYDAATATLVKRKAAYPIDGFVVVVGVATLLRQCHPSFARALLDALGQFVCASIPSPNAHRLAPEVINAIWFVDALCRIMGTPRPDDAIPAHIFAEVYKAHDEPCPPSHC